MAVTCMSTYLLPDAGMAQVALLAGLFMVLGAPCSAFSGGLWPSHARPAARPAAPAHLQHHDGAGPGGLALTPCRQAESRIMEMHNIAFGTTDWSAAVPGRRKKRHGRDVLCARARHFGGVPGAHGESTRRATRQDHWRANRAHPGSACRVELRAPELEDGRTFTLRPGMSYQVADNAEPPIARTHPWAPPCLWWT